MPDSKRGRKDIAWARRLVADIDKMYARVMQDPRSKAAYWNGDDWGSISGCNDADEWKHNEVAKLVLRRIRQLTSAKKRKGKTK